MLRRNELVMVSGIPGWVLSILVGVILLAVGGSLVSTETEFAQVATVGWVTIIGGVIIIGIIIKQAIR